jgi:NADH dehydrogenase FAD-containing subunit
MTGNVWRLVNDNQGHAHITLIPGNRMFESYPDRLHDMARASFLRRGISVREGAYAATIGRNEVVLSDGQRIPADVVLVATGIRPSNIFRDSGLPIGPDGGLLVDRYLRSTAWPEIFGGGDCISFEPRPLAKVGVYAVRQNMILHHNILAALNSGTMTPFEPQKDFLLIFNMGDGRAILIKKNFVWDGRSAWWLKDRIDRAFMRKFQVSGERDEALS